MSNDRDENEIVLMAEVENGDSYLFTTADPERARQQYVLWISQFGLVQGNDAFNHLVKPLLTH